MNVSFIEILEGQRTNKYQDDLNKLAQWEEAWHMKFNVAKCQAMRVMKHPLPKQIIYDYSLHNQVLENVPKSNQIKSNPINFIGSKSSDRTVTSHI